MNARNSLVLVVLLSFSMVTVYSLTYTHDQAVAIITAADISINSTDNCSNQNIPTCTSFEGIHWECLDGPSGIIAMKNATVCEIVLTGGTEVGHDNGTYSHPNGWKLDVRMNLCITAYINSTCRPTAINLDNETVNPLDHFRSQSGNVYYNEKDHWDMTFAPVDVTTASTSLMTTTTTKVALIILLCFFLSNDDSS